MTGPEFSRPVRVDTLGEEARQMTIEAEEDERAALARRFHLADIESLRADTSLLRKGKDVEVAGRVQATVSQNCVVTGDPVEAAIDTPFKLEFRPQPSAGRPDEEVELSEAEMDIIFYQGATIDLGEAVAETLALSLDPYPRSPGAEAALKAAGVKTEEEAGPFGALAELRDKLKKR